MADQTTHLRDAAIEAGRAAIAHWEMIGEPEATQLVTEVLDAAIVVLRDIVDPLGTVGPLAGASAPTMLNVLCECGHRAGVHGHNQGIPDSWCYERVDVERYCSCKRFVSTGVVAAPTGNREPTDA